ncbi:MAG TPA: hypothetical protein PLX15_03440 [Candidatus Woesearchaeota archaeon]|nr:hypothetical protein [Candidatus Woesearchaeota archaeon]
MRHKNKSGIIFSLDILVSIALSFLVIIAIFSLSNTVDEKQILQHHHSYDILMDTLTTLETSEMFDYLLRSGDQTTFITTLGGFLPNSMCAKVYIFYSNNSEMLNLSLPCFEEGAESLMVVHRSFIVNNTPYYCKLEAYSNE